MMLNSRVYVLVCLSCLGGQLLLHSHFVSGEETNNFGSSQRHFNIDCDPQNKSRPSCHSLTLNSIADNATETSHVFVEITTSQLQLNGTVEFRGYKSLTINGDSTVITCTERDSGLVFADINKVTIVGIILTKCGTHHINSLYYNALLLLYCGDVVIKNVSITKNKGRGLSIVDHQGGGAVNVVDSNFTKNMITSVDEDNMNESQPLGGGGVFIGLYLPSGMTLFRFENCVFAENIPHTHMYNYAYTDEHGAPISGYSRGGGVLLRFEAALTDIHVEFHKCEFLKNGGFLGGGLSAIIIGGRLESGHETRNVTVTVRDSLFKANGCSSKNPTGSGGGAHLSFSTLHEQSLSHCAFRFINVIFSNNCAEIGGGVHFYSNYRKSKTVLNSLLFDNCTFIGNQAHIGTAIDLSPNFFDRSTNGFLLIPSIKDCKFLSNKIVHSINTNMTVGTGTIYSSQYSINFKGHSMFCNNSGTALYLVNGLADFSGGNASFINNRGHRGGAVALLGLSSLLVGPEGNYMFVNNTADDSGGAVYSLLIDKHDYTVSRSCFIQYVDSNNTDRVVPLSEWEANITFVGNRAKSGTGHAIFVTSLYPCQVVNNGTVAKYRYSDNVLVKISDALALRGLIFDDDPLLQPQVATEGHTFEVNKDLPLQIIPGQRYSHGVTFSDDLGNPVKTDVRASVNPNSSVKLGSTKLLSCLSDQVILNGEPEQTGHLYLHTVSQRQIHIQLEFELVSCPPGFKLDRGECVCNAHAFIGLLRCDTNYSSLHSYLTTGFWIGLIEDINNSSKTELVTAICPFGFCDYNDTHSGELTPEIKLPQNVSRLDEAICGKSRTGINCGDCITGYTTRFHSPKFYCKPVQPTLCKIGWLFYIVSELVPVTVVFISVLALNINFTSGSVNGFILFSQLINSLNIDAGGLILLSSSSLAAIQGYKIIYGFFNLDYFNVETLSFCLWTNASALDMIAFKYVTIVYALFLIFIVVWFMNKCGGRCLGKWFRITKLNSSVTHGITTFLVMSYAQCMNVSLALLLRYEYDLQDGSQLNTKAMVWMNGNLAYFGGRHLIYALPALVCILTIGILPLIFLLFYPLIYKVTVLFGFENKEVIRFISDKVAILKPLLDSFQGCFKDNMRFFAGFYFVYRWVNLAAYASPSSYSSYYTVVEILLICMLALHAICQPYVKRVHNTIDTLLFTNMAIINAISFGNYYRFRNYGNKLNEMNNALATVQLVLIYLPVVIYITVMVWQNCLNHPPFRDKIQKLKLSKIFSSASSIHSVNQEVAFDDFITSNSEYRYMD